MSEIFEIITAINRLKEKLIELNKRVDFICRYPSVIGNVKYIDEKTACKMLKKSRATLRRMRSLNQISYIKAGKTVLYKLSSIEEYFKNRSKIYKSID